MEKVDTGQTDGRCAMA